MNKLIKLVIAAVACAAVPVLADDVANSNTSKIAQSTEVAKEQPVAKSSRGMANPFTGQAADFEVNAETLALVKQRRQIAEQRLAEQRALADMEKVKREAAGTNVASNVNNTFIKAPNGANGSGIEPKSVDIAPASGKHSRKVSKSPSVGPLVASNVSPISMGPMLIGVTESGGRRYAIFESNGKAITIPEGSQQNGISVGEINGREVVVNGVKQSVNVGQQEVAYNNDSAAVGDLVAGNLFPSNRPGIAAKDMATLRLPAVGEVKPALGPQPFNQQ